MLMLMSHDNASRWNLSKFVVLKHEEPSCRLGVSVNMLNRANSKLRHALRVGAVINEFPASFPTVIDIFLVAS